MRMLKFPLKPGMNAVQCDPDKLLILRYLNDQAGKIMGWFEEQTVLHSDAFEYEVYLALTGEQVPGEYDYICSHQVSAGGGYFVIHAYD